MTNLRHVADHHIHEADAFDRPGRGHFFFKKFLPPQTPARQVRKDTKRFYLCADLVDEVGTVGMWDTPMVVGIVGLGHSYSILGSVFKSFSEYESRPQSIASEMETLVVMTYTGWNASGLRKESVVNPFDLLSRDYSGRMNLYELVGQPLDTSISTVLSHPITEPPSAAEDADEAPNASSREFAMFTQLRNWLNLTAEEAADVIGVGRTTPNSWKRDKRAPRPSSVHRLYQLHALVAALIRTRGQATTINWFESGSPSPRALATQGEMAPVIASVESQLIDHAVMEPRPGDLIADEGGAYEAPRSRVRRRGRVRPRSS